MEELLGTIQFLSSRSASVLLSLDQDIAIHVVTALQSVMLFWESGDVILDPVQGETVIDSVVAVLAGAYTGSAKGTINAYVAGFQAGVEASRLAAESNG